mmetsp:Transcript_4225/g.8172  ORF Transcript_4225/g.8172 Transcript_4225/m.8172 type:complete len:276 (+) Transcript_4225:626-1453(+)
MRDPDWHKALFYREPLERFLSAFLDKCVYDLYVPDDKEKFYHCNKAFGVHGGIEFGDAVRRLRGITNIRDPHFVPQNRHCGGRGIAKVIHLFKTVEQLNGDVRNKVRSMLEKFDLSGEQFDAVYPKTGTKHETDSTSLMQKYYTRDRPELVSSVINFYFEDYTVFNISLPEFAWEALIDLRERNSQYALDDENMITLMNVTNKVNMDNRIRFSIRQSADRRFKLQKPEGEIVLPYDVINAVNLEVKKMNQMYSLLVICAVFMFFCTHRRKIKQKQ